jgi:ABC-type multidrug transport system fused ATPase/permease subunit
MGYEIYVIWAIRIGFFLFLLGLLLPGKTKKTILSKILHTKKTVYRGNNKKGVVQYLDRLSERNFFRPFRLKKDSDEYQKLDGMISQAGGLGGIHPNIVQLFRVFLPPIGFLFLMSTYLVNVVSSRVTPSQLEGIVDSYNQTNSLFQPVVVNPNSGSTGVSPFVIMWIFIGALLLYFVPEMFIKNRIKARKEKMKKELPVIESFVIIMLETGTYTVYDILKTLLDTSDFFRPYIMSCLNEYYVDPKQAIQNMSDKVQDEEFQMVCNSLKQAVDMDKNYTAMFMKQQAEQIRKIHALEREAKIKKKPLIYVFLLAMPLFSIVIIWLYPWFVKAMKLLSGF